MKLFAIDKGEFVFLENVLSLNIDFSIISIFKCLKLKLIFVTQYLLSRGCADEILNQAKDYILSIPLCNTIDR